MVNDDSREEVAMSNLYSWARLGVFVHWGVYTILFEGEE